MMSKPLVSVISINYNQAKVTCDMLASLQKVTYPNLEIIVVDNASPTEEPSLIEALFPEVKLIRSATNLGFAGGNNLGVSHAQGDYLLFLNNDTEVEPDFIEPLVQCFEEHPQAGIASPKIIYYGTDKTIQYAGSQGINPWTGRSKGIGQFEKDMGQHQQSRETALADGAAMMVPRKIVEEVGLMPELFFVYYEELDWCEMIKRAGYSCHYIAEATIYHKESITIGKSSVLKTYYMNRNRLLFIRRNIKGFPFWTSLFIFLFAALPKKALEYGKNQEWNHLKALGRGLWWNLTNYQVQNKVGKPAFTPVQQQDPILN